MKKPTPGKLYIFKKNIRHFQPFEEPVSFIALFLKTDQHNFSYFILNNNKIEDKVAPWWDITEL